MFLVLIKKTLLQTANNSKFNNNDFERIRKKLEAIAIKHRNEIESSGKNYESYSNTLKDALNEVIDELKSLASSSSDSSPRSIMNGVQVQDKLIRQNQELVEAIKTLNEEKTSLRNNLVRLEDELWQYKRNNKVVSTIQT